MIRNGQNLHVVAIKSNNDVENQKMNNFFSFDDYSQKNRLILYIWRNRWNGQGVNDMPRMIKTFCTISCKIDQSNKWMLVIGYSGVFFIFRNTSRFYSWAKSCYIKTEQMLMCNSWSYVLIMQAYLQQSTLG